MEHPDKVNSYKSSSVNKHRKDDDQNKSQISYIYNAVGSGPW